MLRFLLDRLHRQNSNACFCTLAIHAPYRQRARLLIGDAQTVPWIVLTDEPNEFADLPVRAVRHVPTGPMAIDFVTTLPPTGNGRGRPAYHDKVFVLQETLTEFDTAIFIDADTRIGALPKLPTFRPGIAVVKELNASITEHLSRWGPERRPAFEELAVQLTGDAGNLRCARWCSEALFAITKDGNENRFLEAWARGGAFLHSKGLFTGEGGVIGLAAMSVGWTVDYKTLHKLEATRRHEGGGPKLGMKDEAILDF